MKRLKLTWLSLLFFFGPFIADGKAEISKSASEEASLHYEKGEYEDALVIWYAMAESGHYSADLYYNIGITESMIHNTSAAIIAYEQALRLKPLNKEIKLALIEERKKIENATTPVSPFFLQQWYKGLLSVFTPGYWAMLGLVLLFIVVANGLTDLKWLPLKPMIRKNLRWIIGGMGVISILLSWLAIQQIYRNDEAILEVKCEFRQAPSDESPSMRILYPGEKATIKDQLGDWYNIYLLNLDAGWVKKDCLKPILIKRV